MQLIHQNINITEGNVCCKKGSLYFVIKNSYSNNENTFVNIYYASTLGSQNSENKHANSKKKKGRYICLFFTKLYDRDIHAQIDRLSKSRQ